MLSETATPQPEITEVVMLDPTYSPELSGTATAKKYVLSYKAIELTDGSIVGYVKYNNSQPTEKDKDGLDQLVLTEDYDFVNDQVSKLAKALNYKSYIDPGVNSACFIISKNVDRLVGYYINCTMGYFAEFYHG